MVSRRQARESIPLAEETLRVEKKVVSRGTLRIGTRTEQVEDLVRISLKTDECEIKRVAVGQRVDTAPPVRTEGDVTIIPILEEVLHVEKHLVLVEEVHVRRHVISKTVDEPVSRRQQRLIVEQDPPKLSQDEADNDL
jgi:uncharacterized protein (TIGR02271 family)